MNGIARLTRVTLPQADADMARPDPGVDGFVVERPHTNSHYYERWRIAPNFALKLKVVGNIGSVCGW